ncbi:MAG: hypothetical protein ACI93R_002954 [Flavobacteriales bacterium]|jgi:hypothetical protein
MNKEIFWEMIEISKSVLSKTVKDGNLERQAESVKHQLMGFEKSEVLEYAKILHELKLNLYTWELWGAAYVMGGGCSDDSFSDFRCWVISLGKEGYELALTNPDGLCEFSQDPTVEDFFFEEFSYIADEVFEDRFGDEIDIEYSRLSEPKGKEWDEDKVEGLYPKLAELYA